MKNVSQIILSSILALTLFSCARGLETECIGDICTEQELNQSVQEISEVQSESSQYADEFSQQSVAQGNYSHVDPNGVVPKAALNKALSYFDTNYSRIKNKRWLTIADLGQHSSKKRLYLIEMVSGKVSQYHVAHGAGSDSDADGYATQFSNVNNSRMSSLGFFLTAETYIGSHGYSMRLDGLQSSNSRARDRAIVVHPADYVSESQSRAGRSWGCPAMDPSYSRSFIDKVKSGSLYYIYNANKL